MKITVFTYLLVDGVRGLRTADLTEQQLLEEELSSRGEEQHLHMRFLPIIPPRERTQSGLFGSISHQFTHQWHRFRNYMQERVSKEQLALAILNTQQTLALSYLHQGIDLSIRDFSVRTAEGDTRPIVYSRWLEDMLFKTITNRLDDMEEGEIKLYNQNQLYTIYNKMDLVRLLLRNNVNVNADAAHYHGWIMRGWTPLTCAARENEFEIFELLIQRGANVDGLNKKGEFKAKNGATPISEAIRSANVNMIQYLIAYGANIHAAHQSSGSTALMIAVYSPIQDENKKLEMMRLLCDDIYSNGEKVWEGCDVNSVAPKQNWVALHFAAMDGSRAVVKELLDRGTNKIMKIKNYRNP